MLQFNRRTKVYACVEAMDMRASFDRLYATAKNILQLDPESGHLFVFVNRRRTTCKALYWDGTGLVLIYKRLEKGMFSRLNWLHGDVIEFTPAEFSLFFEGVDLSKRFIESPKEFTK